MAFATALLPLVKSSFTLLTFDLLVGLFLSVRADSIRLP